MPFPLPNAQLLAAALTGRHPNTQAPFILEIPSPRTRNMWQDMYKVDVFYDLSSKDGHYDAFTSLNVHFWYITCFHVVNLFNAVSLDFTLLYAPKFFSYLRNTCCELIVCENLQQALDRLLLSKPSDRGIVPGSRGRSG